MADRPIIFSASMVRAMIEGRKTQTRRLVPQPPPECSINYMLGNESWLPEGQREPVRRNFEAWGGGLYDSRPDGALCGQLSVQPRQQPGDRLWVREAHALLPRTAYRGSVGTGTIEQREHPTDGYSAAVFREGFDRSGRPRWRPSIHMPRWASRLTLVVTEVRVERLQDISEADCDAEVFGGDYPHAVMPELFEESAGNLTLPECFARLWNSIHGADAWDANPWVAAITFEVHRANIDDLPSLSAGGEGLMSGIGAEGPRWRKRALCPFCQGGGHYFHLRAERMAWRGCTPCEGTGVLLAVGPATLRIGSAQGKYLRPYPDDSPSPVVPTLAQGDEK